MYAHPQSTRDTPKDDPSSLSTASATRRRIFLWDREGGQRFSFTHGTCLDGAGLARSENEGAEGRLFRRVTIVTMRVRHARV